SQADVVSNRRPLPVDLALPAELRHETAVAVPQTCEQRRPTFGPENVAVRPAIILERVLDDAGQTGGHGTEKSAPSVPDLFNGKLQLLRLLKMRRKGRQRTGSRHGLHVRPLRCLDRVRVPRAGRW